MSWSVRRKSHWLQKIKLNNKPFDIPSVSELSFKQFNEIIVKGDVTDLKEYISLFTNIDMATLMASDFSGASLPALSQSIFDVEVDKVMNDEKETVTIEGKTIAISSLSHATFGKNYYFDLYHGLKKHDKINMFELCLYALAIALTPDAGSMKDIGEKYKQFEETNWMKVLPQGFFLARRYSQTKRNSIALSVSCIVQSKLMTWKINFSKRKLIILERI